MAAKRQESNEERQFNHFPTSASGKAKAESYISTIRRSYKCPPPWFPIFWLGAGAKPWYFTSRALTVVSLQYLSEGRCKMNAPGRISIPAAKFHFWGSRCGKSSKTRGWSSQRSYAVWFLIYVYPIDISSRLKSPPTSLGSPQQKMWGGVYFMWWGEIITVQIFLVLPPIFQS